MKRIMKKERKKKLESNSTKIDSEKFKNWKKKAR